MLCIDVSYEEQLLSYNSEIHYQLAIASTSAHVFDVSMEFEASSSLATRLTLPAWIPGSYMIRDFAKNILYIVASHNGKPIELLKLDKQTWEIPPIEGKIQVQYRVYAFDLSVRSAYITDEWAFFNGTSVFLKVEHLAEQPCVLTLKPSGPDHWQIATSLPKSSADGQYRAIHYADLVDHPVLMGEFETHCFEVQGVSFELIFAGGHHTDMARICEDLRRICDHHLSVFGQPFPIQRYLFVTLLCDSGFGGLEHSHSTVLQYSRDELPSNFDRNKVSEGYRNFLALCSHELFHTWHVKSSKPEAFVHAPLSHEVYSEQLWIYEGFTSYVDDFSLLRCGLIDQHTYLNVVAQTLTRLARNPGADLQTVTESSFDAWTRFYQQDANAANAIVSYYTKGAMVALCLDLQIRLQSDHRVNLLDLITLIWREYGLEGKGTPNDVIQKLLHQRFSIDVDDFLEVMIYSTEPLPVKALLAEFGIELKSRARTDQKDKGGEASGSSAKLDFAALYTNAPLGVKITQVLNNRSACMAGLHVGDILIAVQGWQVSEANLQVRLNQLAENHDALDLTILRDGKLKTLTMPVVPASADTIELCIVDSQKAQKWLSSNPNIEKPTT